MHDKEDISQDPVKKIMTRNFVLGFLAFFLFFFAYSTLIPTLPIYLVRSGSNAGEIGILIGIIGVASLVGRLLVGGALHKYSEKQVMMFGAIILAFSFPGFIALRPFWPLLTVRLFQGIAFACMDTATLACVINVVPLPYRTRAIGYTLMASPLAMTVAAPFGMYLMNRYGFTVLLLTGTALSVCTLCFSSNLRVQRPITPKQESHAHHIFFFERKIVTPAITSLLQYTVWSSVAAFFPLYAIRCHVTNPGLFFSATGLMMVVGRVFGGRVFETWRKENIILISLSASTVALVILFLSRTLPLFVLAGMIWGAVAAFIFPASMAYALEYSALSSGTALSSYQIFMDLGISLGPVIAGVVIPHTGYPALFLCLAVMCLMNLAYFLFYVRRRGNRVHRPETL